MSLSRGTWVGIGVTVLVGGLTLWFGGYQRAGMIMTLIGIVITVVALLILEKRKQNGKSESVSQAVTQTANPSFTANPTINVHLPPQTSPVIASPAPVGRPKPNIMTLTPQIRPVAVNRDHGYFFDSRITEFTPSDRAALAYYVNEPQEDNQTGTVLEVRGQIIYRDEDGNEIDYLRVQTGGWLQSGNNMVNFPPLARHSLIIALKTSQGFCVIQNDKEEGIRSIDFTRDKLIAEAKLVTADGHVLLSSRYLITATTASFSIKAEK
jgi:hypothetical protein